MRPSVSEDSVTSQSPCTKHTYSAVLVFSPDKVTLFSSDMPGPKEQEDFREGLVGDMSLSRPSFQGDLSRCTHETGYVQTCDEWNRRSVHRDGLSAETAERRNIVRKWKILSDVPPPSDLPQPRRDVRLISSTMGILPHRRCGATTPETAERKSAGGTADTADSGAAPRRHGEGRAAW